MLLPLAEFSPLSSSAQVACVSLLSVALICVSLWALLRRQPPLDAHLAKFEAAIESLTKSVNKLTEVQEESADHASRIRQLEAEIPAIKKTVGEFSVALPNTVGQCAATHRAEQSRVTREWFDRIEKVETGMSKNFQTMEGAIGRVEGQLALLIADR